MLYNIMHAYIMLYSIILYSSHPAWPRAAAAASSPEPMELVY